MIVLKKFRNEEIVLVRDDLTSVKIRSEVIDI